MCSWQLIYYLLYQGVQESTRVRCLVPFKTLHLLSIWLIPVNNFGFDFRLSALALIFLILYLDLLVDLVDIHAGESNLV